MGSAARVSLRMVGCAPSLAFLSFLLLINISQASLMTRIGLRLGGKHSSVSHQVGTHRSRVPWAVRIQREEEQEEWGKKDKERVRARVAEQEEGVRAARPAWESAITTNSSPSRRKRTSQGT